MTSAFGVEHRAISKMVVKKKPGKLRRIQHNAVLSTHKIVNAGAGPTPVSVALKSVTPLRYLAHGH